MRRVTTFIATLVACAMATTSNAADRIWTNPAGGQFADDANWDAAAPGVGDTALFTLPGRYTVRFGADEFVARALLRGGSVTFDLPPAARFELLQASPAAPGLVVATEPDDEATLSLVGGLLKSVSASVADASGSTATVHVTNARLDVAERLAVGARGDGTLVAAGGVIGSGPAALGEAAFSSGLAVLTDESTWQASGEFVVGQFGAGVLTLTGGSVVVVDDDAALARNPGASGAAEITGAGSRWQIGGTLDVGFTGPAMVVVEDGGQLVNRDFATVGAFPDATGLVIVRGPGSLWRIARDFFDGDLWVGLATTGQLRLEDGGAVHAEGDLVLNDHTPGGDLDLVTFRLATAADAPTARLHVGGMIMSNVNAPRMTVDCAAGFVPQLGQAFELVNADAGVAVLTLNTLPALPADRQWGVTQTDDRLALVVLPPDCLVGQAPGDDCDGNGILDACELAQGTASDCNGNGIPDTCDLAGGLLDDCNGNGVPDACDLASRASEDCNENGVPDECEGIVQPQSLDGGLAEFGLTVAVDGDRAIVGAPQDLATGQAYVFERTESTWSEVATLTADDLTAGDRFGHSVDIRGDLAIVGAVDANGVGTAYIFERQSGTWGAATPIFTAVPGTAFGTDVAIDGNRAVVSSIRIDPYNDLRRLAATFFRRVGERWIVDQTVTISDESSFYLDGPRVDLEGDRAAMAGRGLQGGGVMAIFERDSVEWHEVFDAESFDENDGVGDLRETALVLRGDVAVVNGLSAGQPVVLVARHDEDTWRADATIAAPVGLLGFGRSIGIAAGAIVVGADETNGSGAAAVFARVAGAWQRTQSLTPPPPTGDDRFGASVAGDGTTVLVGAPGASAGSGRVYAFDLAGADCNRNGILDDCDILAGTSLDEDGDGIPDECVTCAADVTGDGLVGFGDLLSLLSVWGACGGCPEDLTGDDVVAFDDLLEMLSVWGACG